METYLVVVLFSLLSIIIDGDVDSVKSNHVNLLSLFLKVVYPSDLKSPSLGNDPSTDFEFIINK